MFTHRHPRHRLARLLPAGLRVAALFALPFAAAALLDGPSGKAPAATRQAALADGMTQVARQPPALPPTAH